MPANPLPFEFTQPDGTKITVRLRGDEFFHWHEDMEGFTAVLQGRTLVYARLSDDGKLEPTAAEVGKADPRALGLAPRLLPPPEQRRADHEPARRLYRPWLNTSKAKAQPDIAPAGAIRNLVILCMFSDHTTAAHTRSRADFDTLFNRAGGDPAIAPTGSVRDAYIENSYGIVDLQSTVVAWVTLPETEAYYVGVNNGLPFGDNPSVYPNNAQRMVEDALALVDPNVDFGQFDADNDGYIDVITIIHSGYAAEAGVPTSIWSHKAWLPSEWVSADNNSQDVKVKVSPYHTEAALWGATGTEIVRIGVICHEIGHFFGLPDLYDTDGTSRGIGKWCMMADSWGFDGDQLRPSHFSAWCKVTLGWVTPTELTVPDTYVMAQAESASAVFKITRGFPAGEYLLIENRQPVGLDSSLPRGGLAIWHIDENAAGNASEGFPGQQGWPENGNHFKVALLQADGGYHLEKDVNGGDAGDLFQPLTATALGIGSVPNTDTYQAGVVNPTSNRIAGVSAPGFHMSFRYEVPNVRYVDKFFTGTSNGSATAPFKTVQSAYNAAVDGDAIVIRAADYDETLPAMSKKVTINSRRGAATVR